MSPDQPTVTPQKFKTSGVQSSSDSFFVAASKRYLLRSGFLRACLAGIVLVFGCSLAALFKKYFLAIPEGATGSVVYFIILLSIIYSVVHLADKLLKKHQLKEFYLFPNKGERLTLAKILGLVLGAISGLGIFMIIFAFTGLFREIMRTKIGELGEMNADCMTALLIIAATLSTIMLYRYASR